MRTCPTCGGGNDDAAPRCAQCGTSFPPAPPPIVVQLVPETLVVAPGGTGSAELKVRNTAVLPDRVTVEVIGDAAAWVAVEPTALEIPAGATAAATVQVAPPLDAGPNGSSVDVGFVVRSANRPDTAAVELGVLELRRAAASPTPIAAGSIGPARPTGILAVAGVAVVAVLAVAGAAMLGGALSSAQPTPAAVATPSSPPPSSPAPTPSPEPTPSPTLSPAPTPTPGPDAPAAWWQDAWDAAAAQGTVLGPLVAEGTTDDGLPFATFVDGAVYQRVTDAFAMSGAIWQAWVDRGGGASPPAGLGFPTSPPLGADPGHRRQLFDDGAIYWSEATGAHVVHGDVWAWWRQLVRDRGGDVERPGDSGLVEPLGYPTSDVVTDATGARIQLEAGRIGVRADGLTWACSSASPPATFAACAAVDPRP